MVGERTDLTDLRVAMVEKFDELNADTILADYVELGHSGKVPLLIPWALCSGY